MTQQKTIQVGNVKIGNHLPFALIAGPCQLESRAHAFEMAAALKEITERLGIGLIYKTSFDKANRTSLKGQRGMGMKESLPIFAEIREKFNVPVLTDVHTEEQCAIVAEAADVLQIPAFLCRQTDLIIAAAKTGKPLNIKKGQFLAPWDMKNVIEKAVEAGNDQIMPCERGACFGYNRLINDMRALPIMAAWGYPVVFDATHSVQEPGGLGAETGGQREMAPVVARGAIAVGVAAVFMETHENPDHAPSDGKNMIKLHELEGILRVLKEIDAIAKAHPVSI